MISLVLFSAGLRLVRSSYIALHPFLSTLLYQLCEIYLAWSIILSVVRIFTLSVVCITISIVYSHTVSFKPHSVICILGTCIVSCKHQAVSCKLSSSAVSFYALIRSVESITRCQLYAFNRSVENISLSVILGATLDHPIARHLV